MDLCGLELDAESFRARHSECIDLTTIRLAQQLRDAQIPFTDADIATVPAPLAELLAQRLESLLRRESTDRATIERLQQEASSRSERLEHLVDATERVRGEARVVSEKISAALNEYRREAQLEKERQRERHLELQELFRQIEKKDLELRKETMERERLQRIYKKVAK
ncbi:hypothetical protein ERJ75_000704500 [Trypanosoma vivax]|uniref:Uncharacterized protein n=1 Tax=Trypanosoma vivax (strain Y486) TaxID=1055687 RepID=G0TU45_TRYVY|nr:hypothetical protein TRVL_00153 [Trypanosoma vivax]KAH8613872.1 hypothetical protein ERJ75_000704500 [Trypanosoma vivax]CCC47479.1 conserved hypothetical protein [Trypanosoma vivax Y486]